MEAELGRTPSRRLILGSDQRTWGSPDEPALFAGPWCCRPSAKAEWGQRDHRVIPAFGLDRETRTLSDQKVRLLENRFLAQITNILNEQHALSFEVRHTKILLGHWLRRAISLLLHKISVLQACGEDPEIDHVTLFEPFNASIAPVNSAHFVDCTRDDTWNQQVLGLLLPLVIKQPLAQSYAPLPQRERPIRQHTSLKHRLLRTASRQLQTMARAKDHFFLHTYLGLKKDLKLQASLGQIPQLWHSTQFVPTTAVDRALRETLGKKFAPSQDTIEQVIGETLFQIMPLSYLEGFPELQTQVEQLPWPKTPRLIFTGNSFDTDDMFKLWCIEKIKTGSKYVVGQHGNNYGTMRFTHPTVEEETSDQFITWGWSRNTPPVAPGFVFKNLPTLQKKNAAKDGLLLMQYHREAQVYPWDTTAAFQEGIDEQFQLLKQLGPKIYKAAIIRCHPASQSHHFDELKQLHDFDPSLQISQRNESLSDLMQRSRLVVFAYDSTGILECLQQNIPLMAYWQHELDHVTEQAKPSYVDLYDAGIIHFSAKTLAEKINMNWDNIDDWWLSETVQMARKQFCATYARSTTHPTRTMRTILQNAL